MVCKYLIRQNSPTVSCSRNDYHLQFVCILLGFIISFSVGLFLSSPFLSLSFPHWLLLSFSAPSLFSSLQSDSFPFFLLLEHTWDWGSKIWLFLSLSKFYLCVCVYMDVPSHSTCIEVQEQPGIHSYFTLRWSRITLVSVLLRTQCRLASLEPLGWFPSLPPILW